MKKNIKEMGIKELAQLYREKAISPVEVAKHLIQEIHKQKDINAFITVTEELALIQARESEQRFIKNTPLGPMDGIPYAAKDIFLTRGIRTTMGSQIYKDFYPSINATVITKLNGGGAILLGKTNTHEFASGATNDRSYFGPVKNPYNKNKVPGGSSGGSGAALAAHMCPAALGSDTTGSVRLPSAACGTVGMKATQGRISKYGVYSLSDSLDHVGPMTRNVEDNAIFMSALAGYDPLDTWSLKLPAIDFGCEIGLSIKDLVVGVPYSTFNETTEPVICDSIAAVIELLKKLGVKIKEVENLDPDGSISDACRTVRICEGYALHRKNILEKPDLYCPEVLEQMKVGERFKAYEYIKALQMRTKYKAHFKELMTDVDIMLMPAMPLLPTDINQREVEINGVTHSVFSRYNLYTLIASFTGFPALCMLCGLSQDKLPIGLQLMGDEFAETKVYRFAYLIEKELGLSI